jgi:hypothetical protein
MPSWSSCSPSAWPIRRSSGTARCTWRVDPGTAARTRLAADELAPAVRQVLGWASAPGSGSPIWPPSGGWAATGRAADRQHGREQLLQRRLARWAVTTRSRAWRTLRTRCVPWVPPTPLAGRAR